MTNVPLILVADDEESIRECWDQYLRHSFERVKSAGTRTELLELARREKPDVIVTDPLDGSGVEIIDLLRDEPALDDLRIVFTSGSWELREPALEAGADRFLSKPFELAALHQAIDDLLTDRFPPDGDPGAESRRA